MQTQISAFAKEDKAKYFFKELFSQLVCVDQNYAASVSEDQKLILALNATNAKFNLNNVVGSFLFLLVGFVIARKTGMGSKSTAKKPLSGRTASLSLV